MEQTEQRSPDEAAPARLTLEGEVVIGIAGELKGSIAAALEGHAEVVVDCSGATAVDLASLQLLCSAHRTAARLDRKLTLAGCRAEVFGKVVEAAGFPRRRACPYSPGEKVCFWLTSAAPK